MSAIVALTAQNTTGVAAVHEAPPDFVRAELEAVFDDIGVDAAKTGMLFSRRLIEVVADFLAGHRVPLVVDPVMVASSGARLLREDAVEPLVARLFPQRVKLVAARVTRPGSAFGQDFDFQAAGIAVHRAAHISNSSEGEQTVFCSRKCLGAEGAKLPFSYRLMRNPVQNGSSRNVGDIAGNIV